MSLPAAVTVLVSRRIQPGRSTKFEALMHKMMLVAHDFPGHLGGQFVKPTDTEPDLYHVVFAFDTDEHLQHWQNSPARSLGLAALEPLTDGPTQTRQVIGMAHWFMTTMAHQPPPRWRMAVVTWLGIFSTVLLLLRRWATFWLPGPWCRE